jgi:hypothetical protein
MALGVVLAVSAIAPATASARFDNNPVYFHSPAISQAATTPAVRIVHVGDGGFDWGDAAIGAVAGVGLALLAATGGVVVMRRESGLTDHGPKGEVS